MSFSNVGMILAAGYGKRMMPLTQSQPKPLLNINGITLLENSINFLIKLGCKKVIINTHYLNNQIESFINQLKEREKIITIYEKEILDTGGGIKNIIPHINSNNLLVVNSDIFSNCCIFTTYLINNKLMAFLLTFRAFLIVISK